MIARSIAKAGGIMLAAGILALALSVALPLSAGAHAGYARSEPAEGAVLAQSPPRVDVYFSQENRRSGGLPSVIVVNQAGDAVDLGAKLDDDDRTHVSVELPPELPEGRYTVLWHTLSDEDGEEAQGAFHFYVGAGPQPTSTPLETSGYRPPVFASPSSTPAAQASGDGAEDDEDVPPWVLVAGVLAAAAVSGGAGLALGRRLGR